MKITFLGTGTSHGVPMIGCSCAVCHSLDPKNKRFRTSALVEHEGFQFIIDTTPDLRMQCLRENICRLDAILYTHEHSDHLLGLDELRRFCSLQNARLPVYGSARVLEYIARIFPYAVIHPPPYKGLPELDLCQVGSKFGLGKLQVTPFSMPHGNTQTFGFRFDDARGPRFAYLTDAKVISKEICDGIRGVPILILGALREAAHPTHLSISDALEVVADAQPGQTWLVHMSHEVDHETINAKLPTHVRLGYDGLKLEI